MHHHLLHLLPHLRQAHCNHHIPDCRKEGAEPAYPFSHYCGLTKEQFPPPEMLTAAQMEDLSLAMRIMMISWGIDAELPVKLPPDRTYQLLVSVLDRKVPIGVPGGAMLGFCNFEPETCPFEQEYCGCREFFAEKNQRR